MVSESSQMMMEQVLELVNEMPSADVLIDH